MSIKTQKTPIFNSDKELTDFLMSNFTDSLKQSVKLTVSIMVKQEMEQLRKEVSEKLSFNGYYQRNMISGLGKIDNIAIPRFREQPISDLPIESLKIFDSEKEKFLNLVAEMHRLGISQRKVKKLCQTCFNIPISKNRVGLVHQELAEQESFKINNRPINEEFEYLLLDGIWVKVKTFGLGNNKTVLLCALGITKEGKRKIIGFASSDKEDFENWAKFIQDLKQRGLSAKKLKLTIIDDNGGLVKAINHLLPNIQLQVCVAHKMRNVISKVRHKNKQAAAEDLKPIYQSKTKEEAVIKMKSFAKRWYIAEPKAVESLRFDFDKTLTYLSFPQDLWKKIRTTNILEREFREVRRRIKVFDNSFNSDESLNRYGNSIFNWLNNNYPAKAFTH